jgi:hypothetical protein
MIGKDFMSEILKKAGCDNMANGFSALFKEG